VDIVWLHKYASELDGVGDEWKEGAREERKEKRDEKGRRRGHTMTLGQ